MGGAPQSEDAPATAPKKMVRRDKLLDIQRDAQQKWGESGTYQVDAPRIDIKKGLTSPLGDVKPNKDYPDSDKKNKWLVTFPFPYMNGRLHLGHGFSLTKAEF